MKKIKKTMKKINNFFTDFYFFSTFFKTVNKLLNFFTVFLISSILFSYVSLVQPPPTRTRDKTSVFSTRKKR
jgi:hypothetical protein